MSIPPMDPPPSSRRNVSEDIDSMREELRGWLSLHEPADVVLAYYLMHHPANRVQLHIARDASGAIKAALAECHTGYDLFCPLAAIKAQSVDALRRLLVSALPRRRPVYLLATLEHLSTLEEYLALSDALHLKTYTLRRSRFKPVINVLVVHSVSDGGLPRAQIMSQGKIRASAGLNWLYPGFAEVRVFVEPEARGRRWGESVVSGLCGQLLEQGITPIYLADEDNLVSQRLAEHLGFEDTGRRLLFARAIWNQDSESPKDHHLRPQEAS